MTIIQKQWLLITLLFVSVFSSFSLSAQETEPLEKSLLWKVTGNGIKPSYIYGTIHMIGKDDFFLTENTKKYFKKTKCLVLEIDMSNMMGMSMKMLSMAPMKDAKLVDLLSEEDYTLVKNYFEKEASSPELKMMPFNMIENWQPMLLQSFLYVDIIGKPTEAYEMKFLGMAKQQKKMEYGGLETVEDQMAVFQTMPYKDQAEALVELIKELKSEDGTAAKEFQAMVDLYKQQDIEGLLEVSSEEYEETEDFQENLINKRNRNWIPKIGTFAKQKSTFFAVGAGHLGGEEGVLNLLKKEGYKLTPLY
ncbi:MAG: TraB/GumN family protein [Saprospiraceae bacterium]|nr:TraB/GumN family protein [Saprospiraceae bacterium]